MITWPTQELFCEYVRRRQAQRVQFRGALAVGVL